LLPSKFAYSVYNLIYNSLCAGFLSAQVYHSHRDAHGTTRTLKRKMLSDARGVAAVADRAGC
jgi:hypothetical protein